jgi:hypothetical protein
MALQQLKIPAPFDKTWRGFLPELFISNDSHLDALNGHKLYNLCHSIAVLVASG